MVRLLTLVAAVVLASALVQARALQDLDSDPYQMLEQLERFYSQAGRPRLGRRGASARVDPDEMRSTLQLLQLHSISDRYKPRPRLGRRGAPDTAPPPPHTPDLESALRLLQLHTIARPGPRWPRYGKRSDELASWNKNNADRTPDDTPPPPPAWLALFRRR